MRYYSDTIKKRVRTGGKTPGLQLARLAVTHGVSVMEVADCVGAARQTVYNWYAGRGVTNAYLPRVERLIKKLQAASTDAAVRSALCTLSA